MKRPNGLELVQDMVYKAVQDRRLGVQRQVQDRRFANLELEPAFALRLVTVPKRTFTMMAIMFAISIMKCFVTSRYCSRFLASATPRDINLHFTET